jgi:3-hydroxyacyl-CoA dehydrogenase
MRTRPPSFSLSDTVGIDYMYRISMEIAVMRPFLTARQAGPSILLG